MSIIKPCECCGVNTASQRHHKFSQTTRNRINYGYLLNQYPNIQYVCIDCHSSHANPELEHWSEQRFCKELGIKPRSKSALNKEIKNPGV